MLFSGNGGRLDSMILELFSKLSDSVKIKGVKMQNWALS